MHTFKIGTVVFNPKKSLATSAAIVVGPQPPLGKVRIRTWEGARRYWGPPHVVAAKSLSPAATCALPLREAKRLAAALFELQYLTSALRDTRGKIGEAARKAEVDRSNFRRLLHRHDMRGTTSARKRA